MKFRNSKISPIEKELHKIEQEEQKLLHYADKHKTDSTWKVKLQNRIPEKVITGLQIAFSKTFYLIFEKGAVIIEKTYDKGSIEKDFQINDYAMDIKGSRKEIRHIHLNAFKSNAVNTVVTTIEGIGLGTLGIGLPDIVLWVGVLLRGVYEIALKYGFDYEIPEEKLFILKMIEASMMSGDEWINLNTEIDKYIVQNICAVPDDDELKEQIEKTSSAFATEMLITKFLQGIPVVGILGGITNPVYYQKIMRYVELKYRKRYLVQKIGKSLNEKR